MYHDTLSVMLLESLKTNASMFAEPLPSIPSPQTVSLMDFQNTTYQLTF